MENKSQFNRIYLKILNENKVNQWNSNVPHPAFALSSQKTDWKLAKPLHSDLDHRIVQCPLLGRPCQLLVIQMILL